VHAQGQARAKQVELGARQAHTKGILCTTQGREKRVAAAVRSVAATLSSSLQRWPPSERPDERARMRAGRYTTGNANPVVITLLQASPNIFNRGGHQRNVTLENGGKQP